MKRNVLLLFFFVAVTSLVSSGAAEPVEPGTVDLRFDAGTPITNSGAQIRLFVLLDDSFIVLARLSQLEVRKGRNRFSCKEAI